VPALRQNEISKLAETGALNPLNAKHRRDALWKGARAARAVGPLLEQVPEVAPESPLEAMTIEERLHADYSGTTVNIGKHPMAHRREALDALQVTRAADLPYVRPNSTVRVAGCVIVRQRPGTAKGIVFLSLEDETGISNVVVMSEMFDAERAMLITEPWLLVEGPLQNIDNVIHIRAKRIEPLPYQAIKSASHDFH
jgi:error-prone DNA polymerase